MTPSPTAGQADIIGLDDGCYLVTGPPGSGKTYVLIQRAVRILKEVRDPIRILVLAYMKVVTRYIQATVDEQVDATDGRGVTALSFHEFCLSVLEHYGQLVGDVNFTVYETESDRLMALRQGLAAEGYHKYADPSTLSELLKSIDNLRLALISPDAAPSSLVDGLDAPLDVAYRAYEDSLKRNGALDFVEIPFLAYKLLSQEPSIARHYRQIYRYILVDEAQDMDMIQYEILKLLCSEGHGNLMLFADTDQSLYGFRGTSSEYLGDFVRGFQAKVLQLGFSLRSSQAIVQTLAALREHSPSVTPSLPSAGLPTTIRGFVRGFACADEQAEARLVADLIERFLRMGLPERWVGDPAETRVTPEDICVMARSRHLLDPVCRELGLSKVPYSLRVSTLFESEELNYATHGLRVLANARDRISRWNLIGSAGASLQDRPDLIGLRGSDLFEKLDSRLEQRLKPINAVLLDFTRRPSPSMDMLVEDLTHATEQIASTNDEGSDLIMADLDFLNNSWRSYRDSVRAHGELSLGGFLSYLSASLPVGRSGVRVLTVHSSKGLEFRVVFVVGMNEGTFPYTAGMRYGLTLADEYRTAYVAFSRASRCLIVTWPLLRGRRKRSASRFISEAHIDVVENPHFPASLEP